jgi:hypothetical protein
MAFDWEVETLRLSLFSNAATRVSDDDWRRLTNQTEEYNRQISPGATIYGGRMEDTQVSLAAVGSRIDIVQSIIVPDTPASDFLTFGAWSAGRDRFLRLAVPWIKGAEPPVLRVAFGTVLLLRTADVVKSYEALKGLLKSVSVDSARMSDLFYRVNWKTTSKAVPHLLVNRITSWAALTARVARMELGGTFVSSSTDAHAVRLEIDNSTDQLRTESFEPAQVTNLIDELVVLASATADNGEQS